MYDVFPSQFQTIAVIEVLPTSEEFMTEIEQYEDQAIAYFGLIMGVTVVTSFIKGLM